MLIDWFTVGAQALNFVILVWMMKHFLYKPILHAIDAREKRVAAELADADAKKAEAQAEREKFQQKNEEFDEQRATLLSQATDEANAERRRLSAEARNMAESVRAKEQETMRNDALDLGQMITRQTREEVFAIARKTLADLATTSLEERMSEVFMRRLREMDGESKARLAVALKARAEPAFLYSAFELPAEQRAAIRNALNEAFSVEIELQYETAPELISGIELVTQGQKVAWSIDDYLGSLEKSVVALVGTRVETERPNKPNAVAALSGEIHEQSA